jgi:cytochrome c oxidase assembly protein subunit 11
MALNAAALAVAMVCMAYASVPLYRIFCQVTGFGGTTREGTVAPGAVAGDHEITVRFNADTDKNLPWKFAPVQHEMRVKIGEQALAHFWAENIDNKPVTGQAVYNVVPHEAGSYFVKIQCFCFDKQTLKPGQRVDMPVVFYVDPEILKDPEARDIRTITLSYTFFLENQQKQ